MKKIITCLAVVLLASCATQSSSILLEPAGVDWSYRYRLTLKDDRVVGIHVERMTEGKWLPYAKAESVDDNGGKTIKFSSSYESYPMVLGFYIHRNNWTTGRSDYSLTCDLWDSKAVNLEMSQ
jgi:hypothetical protein